MSTDASCRASGKYAPRGSARRFAFWAGVLLLAILAIKGLFVVSQFIGYASFGGQGGTISELIITQRFPTDYWAAASGIAVRVQGYTEQQSEPFQPGEIKEKNLLFDCMQKEIEHEVFATTVDPRTIDISVLSPATPQEVDAYFNKNSTDFDSAVNTYTQTVSFQYGSFTVSAPGTITYALAEDPPITFRTAITKTNGNVPVFVAIVANFSKGFNNRTFNYQVLLPAINGQTYYFFTDPHDTCGEGEGNKPQTGLVYGKVTTTTGSPIPGVIIEVAGIANLTNSSGDYLVYAPIGFQYIYAFKSGYHVYRNNVTVFADNATQHDIILETIVPPNPTTGAGPGVDNPGTTTTVGVGPGIGPGQDVGPGEAPVVPIVQNPKVIEGKDYIVSLMELNRKLRLGQFLQERIFVYSFKKGPASVTLAINGTNISQLITADKYSMTVEPNGKGEFILTIFGVGETGIFNGTLELGGDLNATIPVNIEVLPREQLPVEALHIEIETAEKSYYPGDLVRVKTDLRNLLTDQQYPVRLLFTAQSPDGNTTLWTYETNVYMKTAFSLITSFALPPKTKASDYIIRVSATYLGLSSGSSTIFHVAVPFWQRTLFGLKYWAWLLIFLALAGIAAAVYFIRKNIESKKKFHIKVEMDELPKPGPRSIYVGKIAETDKTTYFNLENFKTHTIVAGSTGGGKSVSAQVIVEEALEKGVAVLVFDPTAQWTGMLRPCKDKMMLSIFPMFGMKPSDAKGFNGNIRQINDAREKIDIKKYVKPGEIQVFACHKLDPKDMDILVANAIREIFHEGFPEEKLLKIMFVFDEVHRLLPKFGGSGDGFLQIERACREFRKWGLGVLLISQVLSDFVGTIKANINTEIQMRTRDEGDLERIRQKYGEDVLRSLVKATVGSGMVENPAYNRGKPYFIAFKPLRHSVERLKDEEIEQYNTYNDQIDNLYYSLDQLEKQGVDIFDLKLELKLALDKVKTGNFNMVKIYLEGLSPRIDKQWEKLGKKPVQLVRELVNLSDIQAELKKAKEEHDKYEAERVAAGAAGAAADKKEWGWKDDVPPTKILNLKNGMIVINLANLYDEISAMKDNDLPKEFDPEPKPPAEGQPAPPPKNRFATWVLEAIGDTKLAYNLANAKTKADLIATLTLKKDAKPLPDAKPPAWFVQGAAGAPAVAPVAVAPAAAPVVVPASGVEAPAAAAVSTAPVSPAVAALAAAVAAAPVAAPAASAPAAAQPSSPTVDMIPASSSASSPNASPSGPTTPTSAPQPVAAAKSQSTLDALVAPDEQAFRLENGVALHGIKELRDYLPTMDDEMFHRHVGLDYNHFADWINGVFHDDELARKVALVRTREQLLAVLSG